MGNEKEIQELAFWIEFFKGKDFSSFRKNEDSWKIDEFPGLRDIKGKGIDIGCGPLSVFEGTKNDIIAIDPLMNNYFDVCKVDRTIRHLNASGENIPFGDKHFDYSYCCNVIDHTPNPERMVTEIKRVTKDKIFLQVNFDEQLSECHYSLWDKNKVIEMFGMTPIWEKTTKGVNQELYWAIFKV